MLTPKSAHSTPKWVILVVFCLAQFIDVANLSAVNISLPTIKAELNFSESQLPWIVNAFTLTFGTFLLIGGKLGDKYGHKLFFLIGLVWFSIWSLVCGFANSVILLCIARAMQGLGAAATIPNALALIQFTYIEEVEKSRALSVFSSSGALGFGIGLVLGGVFTATIGWKYIFYM
jgi:MFS family permease